MHKDHYLVSAIVSVYNCERFIAGCLEDLERQTIADKLEIVVVDTGSQQNEEKVIRRFQERYDNIVYIRTKNRETVYQAWNRGIKTASAKYITNANSDDRHRKDALEIMVNALENDRNIDVVYYDFIITKTENETFENHTSVGYLKLLEFDRHQLLCGPFIGHQPMWRKSLHEKFGFFDESFEVAGDYEFWLRISERCNFKHIDEYLGLYLESPNSAAHRSPESDILEKEKIRNKYMISVSHNKKLLKVLKRKQSVLIFYLGCFYLKRGLHSLARKVFLRSINYDWHNFESYQGLIASYFSPKMFKTLKRIKKVIKI